MMVVTAVVAVYEIIYIYQCRPMLSYLATYRPIYYLDDPHIMTEAHASTFPYDVQCVIISALDFDTLKIASLLSRDFQHEAAKRLWRSFTLMAEQGLSPEDARKMLEYRASVLASGSKVHVFITSASTLNHPWGRRTRTLTSL